ncbi:hypothetical protein [Collimonas fungivorans]|uniref:Phage-related tail fiber protein n=1 Tax=Collimonas fungivorans (strain Ter331) TaxID=1005048 RepID=G0AIR0_COLFT|nr:hypothetical protein [Collimonas fungivorans]AEK60843.1 phage-related tail fiber protein [Collimonas fungivorans Ter331]
MPGLQIITTKAGRAALVNAEHNGTAPLKIAEIGFTAAVFTANEDMTTLPSEIKRLKTISGEVVAADTIHVTIRDDGTDTYTVRGIGYWLSNGVLLGIYSQPDPILQKSAQAMVLLQADVIFATIKAASLTFGDANFTNPPATVDRQGVVELATPDETVAGKDAVRAVTPAGLTPAMAKVIDNHRAAPDPHPGYLTPERANALYFRKLPAITSSDTDCDTLLETGVRDVLVANDRGIIAATHLPVGGDGFGTLITVNGGNFIRQVYTEGGTIQRTWERTGFAGATPPFDARKWKLLWDSVTFDPARYLPLSGGSVSGVLNVYGSTGVIGDESGGRPTIEVISDGDGNAAYMTFHRRGKHAVHFGLDVNNQLSVGGWSMGSNSYKLWHAGNFNPADKQTELGYTPVQQGTGVDQLKNVVKIGWTKGDRLKATVDLTDQGEFVFQPGLDATLKKYLALAGGSVFGTLSVVGSTGAIGVQSGSRPTIEVKSAGGAGDAAYMTFHRPDNFAVHFGLDVNNNLSVGGYSMGAVSYKLWHAGNFDPTSKQNLLGFMPVQQGGGVGQLNNTVRMGWSASNALKVTVDTTDQGYVVFGDRLIRLNWKGFGGQPSWLLGGNMNDDVNVYNPSNFSVNYANSAGYAGSAGNADKVANVPMRFQENPGEQPYYLYGVVAGRTELTLYNRTSLAVGSCMSAVYANQLSGQGLGYGGIGGYVLNKNKSGTGLAGAWEQRGQSYDYGSGAIEGNESSTVLWQRVA